MSNLQDIQQRHLKLMTLTAETLGHVLKNVNLEQATTLRDGPEGWMILEILCHLRDFDEIFRMRAERVLAEDHPTFELHDPDTMAIDRAYHEEDFAYTFEEFMLSRSKTQALFEGLTDDQWQRTGLHPNRGGFSLTDAVIQVSHHDVQHIEQITRLLEQEVPGSGALPSEDYDDETL